MPAITLLVLSAADEYLHASSPLLHSLQSLASEERRNLSILVMTSNLPSLVLPPSIFDAIDYVALAGSARSLVWHETIRKYWISAGLSESLPKVLSRRTLMIISPDSQLLERSLDDKNWSNWRDGYMCIEIDETLRAAPRKAIADVAPESSVAYPGESSHDMSILRTAYVAQNRGSESLENQIPRNTTKRVGVDDLYLVAPFAGSIAGTAAEVPNSAKQMAGIGLDQSPLADPLPSSNRRPSRRQQNAQDNDSESDDSSGGEGSLEVGIHPIRSVGDSVDNVSVNTPFDAHIHTA